MMWVKKGRQVIQISRVERIITRVSLNKDSGKNDLYKISFIFGSNDIEELFFGTNEHLRDFVYDEIYRQMNLNLEFIDVDEIEREILDKINRQTVEFIE